MTINESNVLDVLSGQLQKVQDQVIGIFNGPHFPGEDGVVMVVEDGPDVFVTISIGSFLGLQTDHWPKSMYQPILFPKGKTLSQMMQDPIGFDKWYKSIWN